MDNIDQSLSDLQKKVSCFVKNTDYKSISLKFPIFNQFNMNSKSILYFLVPIIIFLILFIWKPPFLTKEIRIEGSLPVYKINIIKLLISTIVISIIINISLFAIFKTIKK